MWQPGSISGSPTLLGLGREEKTKANGSSLFGEKSLGKER